MTGKAAAKWCNFGATRPSDAIITGHTPKESEADFSSGNKLQQTPSNSRRLLRRQVLCPLSYGDVAVILQQ